MKKLLSILVTVGLLVAGYASTAFIFSNVFEQVTVYDLPYGSAVYATSVPDKVYTR